VEKFELASYLKQKRKQQGLSVRELQERIGLRSAKGVTAAQISRIENGNSQPGFDTLQKIAAGLDLPLAILFDGTTEETPDTVTILSTAKVAEAFGRGRLLELILYCQELTDEQLDATLGIARSIRNYVRPTSIEENTNGNTKKG